MDEPKNKHSHGFTWGMIVGGAVVLMLTTKKGREILKELAEGGIDGLEEYVDLEKIKALTSEFTDDDGVVSEKKSRKVVDEEAPELVETKKVSKRKRFFRRSK